MHLPSRRAATALIALTASLGFVGVSAALEGEDPSLGEPEVTCPEVPDGTTDDAVVTDDKGRHLTDLTPADFEVVERGKRPTVLQATYYQTAGPGAAAAPPATTAAPPNLPAMPGTSGLASPERTARVIAIVVDDLTTGFESLVRTRQMLTRYLATQVAEIRAVPAPPQADRDADRNELGAATPDGEGILRILDADKLLERVARESGGLLAGGPGS